MSTVNALSPSSSVPEVPPLLSIRPSRGWVSLQLRELWRFRDLLQVLAIRDLKLRYRQTALGVLWVVFQPLMAAGIFAFVFGSVAKLPSEGVPYFIFSYVGTLLWGVFSSTMSKGSNCLVQNAQLVSKVYFPRLVLPVSTIGSTLIDFTVALGMLAVLLVAFQIAPGWQLLMLPVWLVLTMVFAIGVALVTSAMMVSYRDVQYIVPVLVQLLMYASPVAYSMHAVPEGLRTFFLINPLTGLLEGFRWSLLGTTPPPVLAVVYSFVLGVGVFVLGAAMFKRMERRFADVI